jgi:hypothetical protein
MKLTEDGGSAFPLQDWDPAIRSARLHLGMSLRDYFAAKAMHAAIIEDCNVDATDESIAKVAYRVADAMLAERNK